MRRTAFNRQLLGRLASSLAFRLFILLMILYTLYHCVASFSDRVVTDVVTDGSASITFSGEAVLVRDETVVTAAVSSALCSYPHEDGAKLTSASTLAELYPVTADAEALASKQQTLTAIDRQITLASRYGTASELLSALPALRTETRDELLAALSLAEGGAPMTEIARKADELLLLLHRLRALTGEGQSLATTVASLKAERSALLGAAAYGARTLTLSDVAPDHSGGYFYYASSVDGYENVFNTALLEELTAAQLETLCQARPTEYGTGVTVVGKLVHSYKWRIVLPIDSNTAEALALGEVYPVTFKDGKTVTVHMTLERTITDPTSPTVLAVLCASVTPSGFSYPRFSTVTLTLEQVEGYRVPETALIEQDGESGVYILDAGRVSYRSVRILYRGEGYVIVYAPTTKERTSEEDDRYSYARYLALRDVVITEGDDLYDGKYID